MKLSKIFKSKDIDLITYLRFKGFQPIGNPIQDHSGTRWIRFVKTPELESEIVSFTSGNEEARLLNEFRRTRSFILDTPPQEIGEENEIRSRT